MDKTGKNFYRSGHYVRFFTPEDGGNPFKGIYQEKRDDVLNFIDRASGEIRVLDVGGGMGRISLALAKKDRLRVFLGDLSIDMLKMAKRNVNGDRLPGLVNLDAETLPFMDNSFHFVVGLDLFCHLKDCNGTLKEFKRVLTDDGYLILDSTNSNPLWVFFYPRYPGMNPVKWIKTLLLGGVLPGWERLVRHYRKSQFVTFLRDAGFRVERILNYGPRICPKWHLIIARKVER